MAKHTLSSATRHNGAPLGNRTHRPRLIDGWALAVVAILLAAGPVSAEDGGWTVVVTPQAWLSHIEQNGFSSPPPLVIPRGVATVPGEFSVSGRAGSTVDPQWGAQIIFHKYPWSFGAAVQYVSFTSRYDIAATGNEIHGYTVSPPGAASTLVPGTSSAIPGQRLTQERVDSDRFDVDLALTYFIPDVVKDRLDVNAGVGVKLISAFASRGFFNGVDPTKPAPLDYLYVRCDDAATSCRLFKRASINDLLYGATIPLNFAYSVTDDHRWIVRLNLTPFVGAETRDDHDVIYATRPSASGIAPKRLDGTTFAYGATSDAGIRYTINDRFQMYGAFRVQFLEGHQRYLAWGPMLNLSVRLGR